MNGKVTYHQQVSYCGKPRCRKCREGTGHGPYWYSYQTVDGRTSRTYVGKHLPPDVQAKMAGSQEPPPAHAAERDQSTIRIYVLGQFRLERRDPQDPLDWQTVTDASWQHQRVRALLGCLVSAGHKLAREQIMEALWPDLELETAGSRLDRAVYSLRQLFEPSRSRLATSPLLLTEREMLVLGDLPQIWIDADAFDLLLKEAHASKDPGEKERLFKEASNLYGGKFLPEEHKNEWTLNRREALQRAWIGMQLDLADLYVKRDALNNAIEPLDRLLSVDPTNEAAVQSLMKLLMQLGRRGEALRAYVRLKEVLQKEYSISPLPETRNIYEELRSGNKKSSPSTAEDAKNTTTRSDSGSRDTTTRATATGGNEPSTIQIGRAHQGPLVGREREIDLLRSLVNTTENATRFRLPSQKRSAVSTLDPQRRPQCILLMGDVGIGKTRLAEEVSREAKKRGWAVAWSRVYAQEGSIPYRLWTEILRKAMEQGAWQRQEITRRSLTFQALGALLPELHQLLNQSDFASSLPPEQEQLRLWEAARELLTLISEGTPLLITLDDLQWSDTSSCELFAYLARRIYGLPIIIVGTCRDNELGARHPLRPLLTDLQRENALECISLERLSEEQIISLVSNVPHVPEPMVSRISVRADGNPFFAEELARTISAEPALLDELPVVDGSLPETITAVLDLRMNRLSQDCQRLLSKAAVLGGSFEFNVISAMEASSGADEDTVLDLLEEALKSGMLTEEGTGTRITYNFWHPLLVSHLYEGLSAARRASQHRRAAEVLKKFYTGKEGEGAAIITRHLVNGGADAMQIVQYAELAGDHSYSLSSYSDAESHYRVALEHLAGYVDEWKRRAYILECLAECTRIPGKYEEARNFYEQALEIRDHETSPFSHDEQERENQIKALLWCGIGWTWYHVGKTAQARLCYQRGEQVLQNAGIVSGPAWARLRLQQSYVSWREGNYNEARPTAQEALILLEKALELQRKNTDVASSLNFTKRVLAGDPVDVGRTHVLLSNIEAAGGRCSDALPHLNKALDIFEHYDCLREIAIACCNAGDLYLRTADYSLAQAALRRSRNLAERIGEMPLSSFAIGNLGVLDMRVGNLAEAENGLKNAIILAQHFYDPVTSSMFQAVLAKVLAEQRKLSEAAVILRQALTTGRLAHVTPCIGLALISLGSLRVFQLMSMSIDDDTLLDDTLKLRILNRAKKTLIHALTLEEMEAETKIEGRLILAQVLLMLKQYDLAHREVIRSLEEAKQFDLGWLAARAQSALGRTFASLGQFELAEQHFEQGMRTLRRIGMRLEYGRVLHQYGELLLKRNESGDKKRQRGLSYLQEARQLFTDCGAELDLQLVKRVLLTYKPVNTLQDK